MDRGILSLFPPNEENGEEEEERKPLATAD